MSNEGYPPCRECGDDSTYTVSVGGGVAGPCQTCLGERSGEHAAAVSDFGWVEEIKTVDAIDRGVVDAMNDNPGWRLLHVGMGSGGQTTLTYGWPWLAPSKRSYGEDNV